MSKIHDWGKAPNPGSAKAVEQGCICPVMDNNNGAGVGTPPKYWITGGCSLHDPSTNKRKD